MTLYLIVFMSHFDDLSPGVVLPHSQSHQIIEVQSTSSPGQDRSSPGVVLSDLAIVFPSSKPPVMHKKN